MLVASAIVHNGKVYAIAMPARHHHVIRLMIDSGVKPPIRAGLEHSGFLTHDGVFLLRDAALVHAVACGQITTIIGSVLTSEDLW